MIGKIRKKFREFKKDVSGEVNIVAMVLLIVVVIGLVGIFRDQMTDIMNTLFDQIKDAMGV
jgi:hypothetical protein